MKKALTFLGIISFFIALVLYLGISSERDLSEKARLATIQQEQRENLQRQNEAKRKAQAWKEHLAREAWNKAHPEEIARRKEAERERLAREQEAQRERIAREQQAQAEAAREQEAQQRVAAAREAEEHAREERESHPCNTADDLEKQAADAINADHYQATYDLAVSGLHYSEMCDDDTDKMLNKGYLLSFKAYAEHQLASGDWRTDFNQANALLVECQSTPGLYGTHAGAQCETQEHNNITSETNWDTNS
jgi:hypothetical protein